MDCNMFKKPSRRTPPLPESVYVWEPETNPDQWDPPLIARLPLYPALIEVQRTNGVLMVSTFLAGGDEPDAVGHVQERNLDAYVDGLLDGVSAVRSVLRCFRV